MKLAALTGLVALGLPDTGMPAIISMFAGPAGGLQGFEAALTRASRVNGMDVQPPGAVWLPTGGAGFFGWPAIEGHRDGRQFMFMPQDWVAHETGRQLRLTATDRVAGLAIDILLEDAGCLISSVSLTNLGQSPYVLNRCMAGSLLVASGADAVISYRGKWGQEFHETEEPAGRALWSLENRKGRTSHDKYPAIMIRDAAGGLSALHLGWSGNFQITVDRLDDGRSLAHAGELFEPGEMILPPGASYQSPKAYFAHDAAGSATAIAAQFHSTLRQHVVQWPGGKMKPRPVLLNTWEGNYFKHDVARLQQQASAAAALGIERFVLDDGWFGQRDDDTSSLGDWFVDARKYPKGLNELVTHVTGLGLEFGLWFEPEMVNRNSALYRQHPDWVLQVEGRPLLESRHQLVLDLTRPEVSAYLFSCIDTVLSGHAISYIKWDMNRDLTHAGGADGRAKTAAQTRAVYALMDRVRAAHPHVEIESCSSGGGRADFGVLARTQRVWISDCTDALERLTIQRGARRFLAPEIMGCHISASPNHQTGRQHSLAFRAIVAMVGHLGVELDPMALAADERRELAAWIALHKALRPLLHAPDAHSFDLPVADGRHVFGVSRVDAATGAERLIVAVAQATHPVHEQPMPLRLPLRQGAKDYVVRALGPVKPAFIRSLPASEAMLQGQQSFSGRLIAAHGLPLPQLHPESAVLLEVKSPGDTHG